MLLCVIARIREPATVGLEALQTQFALADRFSQVGADLLSRVSRSLCPAA